MAIALAINSITLLIICIYLIALGIQLCPANKKMED